MVINSLFTFFVPFKLTHTHTRTHTLSVLHPLAILLHAFFCLPVRFRVKTSAASNSNFRAGALPLSTAMFRSIIALKCFVTRVFPSAFYKPKTKLIALAVRRSLIPPVCSSVTSASTSHNCSDSCPQNNFMMIISTISLFPRS